MTRAAVFSLVFCAASGRADETPEMVARAISAERGQVEKTRALLHEPLVPEGCSRARVFRAVYAPSFAAPSVVTLELAASRATVRVITAVTRAADGGVVTQASEGEVPPEALQRVTTALETAAPRTLRDLGTLGVDGVTVGGTSCGPGEGPHAFVCWSPTDAQPRHLQYFRALLDAARATLTEERTLFAVEQTLTYFAARGELIYAERTEPFHTLRLTGISEGEAVPFRALVAAVRADEDLVVDLRNFSGAGTMFRPEFQALDRRKGRTVWVVPRQIQDYLRKSFGVSPRHIVETLDAAAARLKAR